MRASHDGSTKKPRLGGRGFKVSNLRRSSPPVGSAAGRGALILRRPLKVRQRSFSFCSPRQLFANAAIAASRVAVSRQGAWRYCVRHRGMRARTPVYKAQRGRAACDTSLRLRGCGRFLFIGGLMKSLTAIVAIAAALTSASASAQVPKEGTLLLPPPDLNRSGASSVRRTVCWMFLCPR
jgi:hypothetical protein